jgi:hypothetical protein
VKRLGVLWMMGPPRGAHLKPMYSFVSCIDQWKLMALVPTTTLLICFGGAQ